jgi:hypothetical protein
MVIWHSIASDQCRSEILFTTKFVRYFNHRKIGIAGFFLKFQLIKSIMDVAGEVNLFIWELSATLHSSSSFSVCRSDLRLMMFGWDCVDFGSCVFGGGRCAFDSYYSR